MPKRTRSYKDWAAEKLLQPELAASYLNAAKRESPEMFLRALRRVAEARQMTKVAAEAGVSRESLYRMTSETGNPTHTSLEGILRALDLDYEIVPRGYRVFLTPAPPTRARAKTEAPDGQQARLRRH